MKKHLLITLIALSTLTACKKEKTSTTVSPGLYGTWELRTIIGGWGTNQTIAPGKEQYQFNTGDTYVKLKDGKVASQGNLKIDYSGEDRGFKYGVITLTNPVLQGCVQYQGRLYIHRYNNCRWPKLFVYQDQIDFLS